MDGEFITNRKVETILANLCTKHSIKHQVFSDGWVHAFEKAGRKAKLIGYKWSLNDAAASGIAADKVATYQLLDAHGVSAVEHTLLRTKADFSPQWPDVLPEKFVLKPLTGTSGHGIHLCANKQEAESHIRHHKILAWALAPYMQISSEFRLVMLDGECLAAYQKTNPVIKDGLGFFNLGAGAIAEDITPNKAMLDIAKLSVKTLGLRLAAVDIVQVKGELRVLEVNDGFMMEHYLRQSRKNYLTVVELYEKILIEALA
jgi:glutathione synthase/RimK-type ligase-like ATP-grasp enzyme